MCLSNLLIKCGVVFTIDNFVNVFVFLWGIIWDLLTLNQKLTIHIVLGGKQLHLTVTNQSIYLSWSTVDLFIYLFSVRRDCSVIQETWLLGTTVSYSEVIEIFNCRMPQLTTENHMLNRAMH